jgi:hypothetical protein
MPSEQNLQPAWKLLLHKRAPQWVIAVTGVIGLIAGAAGGITINNNFIAQPQPGPSQTPTPTPAPTATVTETVTTTATVTTTVTVASPTPTPSAANTEKVWIATLCNAPNATVDSITGCSHGAHSTVIGSTDFPWDVTFGASYEATTGLNFTSTTCKTVDLEFAIHTTYRYPGLAVTMTVVQQNARPQPVTFTKGSIAKLHANLNGGPWALTAKTSVQVGGEIGVLTAGTAQCETSDGS